MVWGKLGLLVPLAGCNRHMRKAVGWRNSQRLFQGRMAPPRVILGRDPSPCKSAQGSPQGRQARGPGAVNVPSQATGPWQGMTLQRLCRDRTWLPHAGVTTRVLSGGTQSEEPGQKEGSRSQGRITQAGCEGAPASREDVRPPSAFKPLGYGPWLQPPRETHTDVNQKVKCFCEFYQVQRKITHRGFAVFVSSLDSLCQVLTTRCSSFILTFA